MKINTNTWNRIRYTLYTPIYDLIGKIFSHSRERSIHQLEIQDDAKVLLVGAGTGLDIAYINPEANIIATDITPSMVSRIKKKYPHTKAIVMDGHNLQFESGTFDHVILHLIIAVIPDPYRCIKEVDRVLKEGGTVAVFDKFISHDKPSFFRIIANFITSALFSDITRNLHQIIASTHLEVVKLEKADFGGNFQIITLKKT